MSQNIIYIDQEDIKRIRLLYKRKYMNIIELAELYNVSDGEIYRLTRDLPEPTKAELSSTSYAEYKRLTDRLQPLQ